MAKGHLTAEGFIEKQIGNCLVEIEKHTKSDVIGCFAPILFGLDDAVRDAVEDLDTDPKGAKKVTVLIETSGGYVEVARRICDTLHYFYDEVEFIIPGYAMSAGTVLVMSGHAIHMDYYSVLGPIDPQVEVKEGNLVPADGYLVKYAELIQRSADGKITTAELQFLMEKFDPAELYRYEQEKELSVSLLKEWLVQYKFKNWTETGDRKIPVTEKMKVDRAEEIARCLNDTKRWHSHGTGIPMRVLRNLKLQIEDFGLNVDLKNAVRSYHKLVTDYMAKIGLQFVVHTRNDFVKTK